MAQSAPSPPPVHPASPLAVLKPASSWDERGNTCNMVSRDEWHRFAWKRGSLHLYNGALPQLGSVTSFSMKSKASKLLSSIVRHWNWIVWPCSS